ncbi:conserved hypothetical protein [Trichinella spiralis]|uniref:hypothetical protein n=1 Tax=Trichinella spiralis TaxID=6334 RepID=UPI0001EFBEF2|nr:conserved hypothetical protein [Trichinella spiralis]
MDHNLNCNDNNDEHVLLDLSVVEAKENLPYNKKLTIFSATWSTNRVQPSAQEDSVGAGSNRINISSANFEQQFEQKSAVGKTAEAASSLERERTATLNFNSGRSNKLV